MEQLCGDGTDRIELFVIHECVINIDLGLFFFCYVRARVQAYSIRVNIKQEHIILQKSGTFLFRKEN